MTPRTGMTALEEGAGGGLERGPTRLADGRGEGRSQRCPVAFGLSCRLGRNAPMGRSGTDIDRVGRAERIVLFGPRGVGGVSEREMREHGPRGCSLWRSAGPGRSRPKSSSTLPYQQPPTREELPWRKGWQAGGRRLEPSMMSVPGSEWKGSKPKIIKLTERN